MPLPASSGLLLYFAHAALCLLLAAGLAWQAWSYGPGRRRWLRLLAGLLAAAALWCCAYPPQRPATATGPAAALLLTPGYSSDSVRALRRRLGPVPVLRYRPAARPGGDTVVLLSVDDLTSRFPAVREVHLLGSGLPVADWAAWPGTIRPVAHPAPVTPQFTTADWGRQLPLGQSLQVAGRFAGSGSAPAWVRLLVSGRPVDSIRLPGAGGPFVLRYRPRRLGRQLLRLEARRGGTLLAAEPVPLQVLPPRRLRVLLLGGSPSFELNLLKNHLTTRGHQVALRLRLSPGLLQTEAQNQATADLSRLTPALCARYDALVADADALNALAPTEARTLAAAAADGLGVLLIGATELPRGLPGRTDFALQTRPGPQTGQLQLIRWAEDQGTADLPTTLRATPALRPLVTGPSAAPVAASRRTGWGTVLVSTPLSTYQWLLSGATTRYDSYWSTLLSAAARPLSPRPQWQPPLWPRPDEPQALQLTASAPRPPRAQVGAEEQPRPVQLALRQLPGQAGEWQGTFWPVQPGWHRVVAPGLDTAAFYVFGSADWRGPLQTQRLAAVGSAGAGRNEALPVVSTQPTQVPWLPVGWFFALFVAAAASLWLDEKR